MADSNPANFANLPKDKLHDIAVKGGHASHGGHDEKSSNNKENEGHAEEGRNPDGTFTKGSKVASELGHKGGLAGHHSSETKGTEAEDDGRNPDGTFKKGSQLAHELGHQGSIASHQN